MFKKCCDHIIIGTCVPPIIARHPTEHNHDNGVHITGKIIEVLRISIFARVERKQES